MKEFRGTPGEWRLDEWIVRDHEGLEMNGGLQILDAEGNLICSSTMSGASEIEKADVRLMAASKDLLEALQGLMEFAGIIEERLGTAETGKARAAIAKALGS